MKNTKDLPGSNQKLYYHENVYRVSSEAGGFREQTQVGLECMGDVEAGQVGEVLKLAEESLALLSGRHILEISHLDILNAFVEAIATDDEMKENILKCAGEKNLHGISRICREAGIAEGAETPLRTLLSLYGETAEENGCGEFARQLARAVAVFAGTPAEGKVWIDFSATGDLKYYNGIAFKGFLDGVPDSVLSGGQYDKLMKKMGRKDRAIGFAVFLDRLDRLTEVESVPGWEEGEMRNA